MRYKDIYETNGYFNHPFMNENRMVLIDDVGMDKSLSEDSLVSDFDGVQLLNTKGKRNATTREKIDEGMELFDFSKSINK